VVGEPAEAIIEFCQKEAISLVIMTTTGKSGLKRALLGSVTDRVIREPGFPVFAIRPETNLVKA
jgi:nucleotide-binding universal stress UspA family protein